MSLGLLLVPALGGYWLLTHLHFTRYQTVRVSGYHVLFSSALVGGVLFIIAEVALLLLNHWFPQLRPEWESFFPVAYSDTVVLSVTLGVVSPLAGNLLYSAGRAAQKVARDGGDLLELLIAEPIEDQKLVEMSLRSGKSYIGFAIESGIARHGEADVSVIPMASGYRERDTQELRITTNYAPVIQQSLRQSSNIAVEDFRIIIPISEIVSVRIFLPEVYKLFQGEDP